jgi:hypothetical protein
LQTAADSQKLTIVVGDQFTHFSQMLSSSSGAVSANTDSLWQHAIRDALNKTGHVIDEVDFDSQQLLKLARLSLIKMEEK